MTRSAVSSLTSARVSALSARDTVPGGPRPCAPHRESSRSGAPSGLSAGDRAGAAATPAGGRGPRGRAPRPWGRRAGGRPRPRAPPSRRPSPLRGGRLQPRSRVLLDEQDGVALVPVERADRLEDEVRAFGSSPIDGSSIRISRGSSISARAISTIFCSPPDSEPARSPRRSATIGKRSATASRAPARGPRSRGCARPSRTFSHTVISGKRLRSWGTWTTPASSTLRGESPTVSARRA